jgi:hypothetical protein
MTDRFRRLADQPIEVALALAVKPVDAVTGRPLRDEATVSIAGVHEAPRLNPSGYWLFLTPPAELPADPVTVTIDAPYRYIDRTKEVRVDDLETPALRVALYPSTAYEFASATTRIEGTVEDDAGKPIADAIVRIENTDLETQTDTDGSFVLAIEGIVAREFAEGDALRVDPAEDPTLVRDHGGDDVRDHLTVAVDHPQHDPTTVERQVHEGERIVLDSPIVM